ncbi:DUF397 domain-containing protein [Streptomyces sp. NBC_00878]|uniref:DUF397 domain-containing protein n=1 Tax=Streptomyces sp. NBC_00878 TaxID=2975854 RepID=UPI0022501099|nr:DUF397 domain-containing protein [Streptomyces sp. NBC_00878]MCX4907261.1 DUF397 domain-containing protein [Streptomyces sp. NBC_00878]
MAQSLHWQKSSFSGGADGNECVELAAALHTLLIRESDQPTHVIAVDQLGLVALLHHVRARGADTTG